nr:DDE-type integrase/transposase/recombinase [Brucella intermedia]
MCVRLYRTCNLSLRRNRNLKAAKRFIRKALTQHGKPEKITIDGSQTNRMPLMQCDAES